MGISLIVNADDFGLTKGVNDAVLACHLAGCVTSTTLMTNKRATEDAADIARRTPSLAVGLHFNLTSGAHVATAGSVRTLTGASGQFFTRGELLRRAALGRIRAADVQAELDAQLARLKALGLRPTHFDSHQHVHAIPLIFNVLARTAAAEGIPLRLTCRWPGRIGNKSWRRRLNEVVLNEMTQRCIGTKPSGLRTNDGLCSVFDLNISPVDITESSYAQLLAPYGHGFVELMVHPAVVDDQLVQETAITDVSAVENRLLRSDFLRRYVESRGGRMATYGDLV